MNLYMNLNAADTHFVPKWEQNSVEKVDVAKTITFKCWEYICIYIYKNYILSVFLFKNKQIIISKWHWITTHQTVSCLDSISRSLKGLKFY